MTFDRLPETLARIRKARDLSQEQLAAAASVGMVWVRYQPWATMPISHQHTKFPASN
ncbi:hypothetical protein SAMN02982918_2590 [Saccharomonospora viridis]|nr:hypothetical protein SAMN02982918_2590 [Saccharomonospora viridis]